MPSPEDKKNLYNSWTKERLIAELERVSNEFGLRWGKRQADRNFEEAGLTRWSSGKKPIDFAYLPLSPKRLLVAQGLHGQSGRS